MRTNVEDVQGYEIALTKLPKNYGGEMTIMHLRFGTSNTETAAETEKTNGAARMSTERTALVRIKVQGADPEWLAQKKRSSHV
jgi:hypothetical protein